MLPILQHINDNKQDAILWLSARWLQEAGDDHVRFGDAVDRVAALLSLVKNAITQQRYMDDLIKKHKLPKKAFTAKIFDKQDKKDADSSFRDDEDEFRKMPKWMDKEDIMEKGFCAVKTENVVGYYGWGSNGKTRISNFIIHPIFHIDKKEDSQHIFDVENDYRRTTLIVPSKAMVSKDLLQGFLVGAGSSYIFFGSSAQLLLVADHLLRQFHTCSEISHLGWQPEGFYTYLNKIFIPGKGEVEISPYGVAEIDEKHYLIPAASKIYANVRAGDDPYESDRVMKLVQSPITFKQWARQMQLVYGEKGLIGVAFAIMTCFRDLVFAIDNNCPHLYGYGERSSGKSKWAESITAMFYVGRAAFNLNSGTDYGFFSYMQRFTNCPAHLNEFDDKVVRVEWFQVIKGVYDGEGREKGKMGSRNRTEVQRVHGTLVLTGQYLSTQDDNSVVSRSIISPFFEQQFTEEGKRNYEQLKGWEAEGLTSLVTDVIQHRTEVKEKYYKLFNETLSSWRRATIGNYNQRILQNYCHLATMWFIFADKLGLPIDFAQFSELAYAEAIKYSRFIRDTDTLSDFWHTIEFLLDQGEIIEGWDFKITVLSEIKLRKGDGEESLKHFDGPRKLLIIRLNNVHKLYETAYRQRKGEKAMTFENLSHYFANRDYYIGQIKQTQFKKWGYEIVEKPNGNLIAPGMDAHNQMTAKTSITSAYVFDYDLLGCDLERGNPAVDGPANDKPFG